MHTHLETGERLTCRKCGADGYSADREHQFRNRCSGSPESLFRIPESAFTIPESVFRMVRNTQFQLSTLQRHSLDRLVLGLLHQRMPSLFCQIATLRELVHRRHLRCFAYSIPRSDLIKCAQVCN